MIPKAHLRAIISQLPSHMAATTAFTLYAGKQEVKDGKENISCTPRYRLTTTTIDLKPSLTLLILLNCLLFACCLLKQTEVRDR